jgi:hypothetical protein
LEPGLGASNPSLSIPSVHMKKDGHLNLAQNKPLFKTAFKRRLRNRCSLRVRYIATAIGSLGLGGRDWQLSWFVAQECDEAFLLKVMIVCQHAR